MFIIMIIFKKYFNKKTKINEHCRNKILKNKEMSIIFSQSQNDKIRSFHSQICEKYYNSKKQNEEIMCLMLELEVKK